MSIKLPEGYEARYRPFAEFRADADNDTVTIVGHAATFNDPYDLGPFEEQIAPGAFDRAIEADDVRALWNHDPNHPLGRVKSGTLRLGVDDVGLVSEIDLPESATIVREAVKRGDVDQMSFGFRVFKESWDESESRDKPLRTIEEVELWDVSPVTYPANPNTDVAMRSLELRRKDSGTTTESTGTGTTSTDFDIVTFGEQDEAVTEDEQELLDNLTPRQRQLAANDAWLAAMDD